LRNYTNINNDKYDKLFQTTAMIFTFYTGILVYNKDTVVENRNDSNHKINIEAILVKEEKTFKNYSSANMFKNRR